MNQHVIAVIGPTASGKSDFAVELALKEHGEIISCDSRQVFKGLDIGTGKITPAEMKGVPHHMLSVYELDDTINVARFKEDASAILKDILRRGKTPVLCGGTGQYIDALLFDTPLPHVAPNPSLRATLEELTTEELCKRLQILDPRRASAIDTHNRPRLIRAIEIAESIGSVPTLAPPTFLYPTTIYILSPSRQLLRERITARLEKRLAQGMVEEVQHIHDQGYSSSQMKKFGLEYESIAKFLEGTITLEEMKQDIITSSMQYAKRQETWNKKYASVAIKVEV